MFWHFNFFPALFHLGLFAKFHSNSGRVSLPLKFICMVYLLFVRKQRFIKLCITSTLNNGKECLIRNWLYTATFLTLSYCPTGEHPAAWSCCRKEAAVTHQGERASCCCSLLSIKQGGLLLLKCPFPFYGPHQCFCSLSLSSATACIAAPAIERRIFCC